MARKKHKHPYHEEHPDERWLLTYADMITLLMALFIVMFAMAEVDPEKVDPLAKSVREALNGQILPGGSAIMQRGGQVDTSKLMSSPPSPSLQTALGPQKTTRSQAKQEEESLQQLKQRIDSAAAEKGLAAKVSTTVDPTGLTIRLSSDDFLFDSGSAELRPEAESIMGRIAQLLRIDGTHAIRVSGHTDSQPVSGRYPSNWELSTARASAVVRGLIRDKVAPARLEASGRSYLDPVGSNSTAVGRSQNRRVEILIPRQKIATEGES